MYEAKRAGRNRVVVYDAALVAQKSLEVSLAAELVSLLATGALRCRYQTIIAVGTGRIVAVKAEAFFDHPVHGRLDGPLLTRLASRAGCIQAYERTVLQRAASDLASWRATTEAADDLVVAVIMTPTAASSAELVEEVLDILATSGLARRDVVVAITEPDSPGALANATALAQDLAQSAIKLGLVGYGRGALSLKVLTALQVRLIELDAALSDTTSPMNQAVLASIGELARRLDLVLVVPQTQPAVSAPSGALDALGIAYVIEGREHGLLDATEVAAALGSPLVTATGERPELSA
jgi:EAL domain-containing protein (putative c-di-GMP-specific phosphodiesterase class I)